MKIGQQHYAAEKKSARLNMIQKRLIKNLRKNGIGEKRRIYFYVWSLSLKNLEACVRDPETGDVLQLRSDDWIPSSWDDYIPPVIWTDYIVPNNYEAPGPNGTLIRGALRPVFFMRDEFRLGSRRPLEKQSLLLLFLDQSKASKSKQ